ncbi:MAG: hypothetical protein HRT61_13495 [Ekhidna sp.]|nr:hypothetical protein [Ekhidna sp.]
MSIKKRFNQTIDDQFNEIEKNVRAYKKAKFEKMAKARLKNGGSSIKSTGAGHSLINGNELEPHEIFPEAKEFHKSMREQGINLNKPSLIPE